MKTTMPSAIQVYFNFARQGLNLFLFTLVYIPLLFSGAQRKGIIAFFKITFRLERDLVFSINDDWFSRKDAKPQRKF
jgi:hypothetical protein